jgi:hypothetical protein
MFVPLAPAAKKTRRGPPAALSGAGVWRHASGNGLHFPSMARHAAFNDQIFAGLLSNESWHHQAPPPRSHQIPEFYFQISSEII